MSERAYLKALNEEIQRLNLVIDRKILMNISYREEARRHKRLLTQLRKDQARRKFSNLLWTFFPSWR